MNKVSFAFASIAILLAASILPSVGSENVSPVISNEKTIEVPFKIYTLHGVKEIKKELPINKAKELLDLFNETRDAVKLLNSHVTFKEKMEANAIIDSFLFKMKENGLLGNLSIKEAKELITGEYLREVRSDLETQRMKIILKSFEIDDLKINAICYFEAYGGIGYFPWNIPLFIAGYIAAILFPNIWFIEAFFDWIIILLNIIPHPTTVGYWKIIKPGPFSYGNVYVNGLLGEDNMIVKGGECVKAITIGFTGIQILWFAIGFCPFIVYKYHEKQ